MVVVLLVVLGSAVMTLKYFILIALFIFAITNSITRCLKQC